MSFLTKDGSFVNRLLFPAPDPATYTERHFQRTGPGSDGLFWIPRRNPQLRHPLRGWKHQSNSIPCLWLPTRAPGAEYLLLAAHGNAEDLGTFSALLTMFRDRLQVHVVGLEYPGYGVNRTVSASEGAVNADVMAVYTWLTQALRWPPRKILLFGFSIGTGPMTNLASLCEVGGLTLLAPYSSIKDMVRTLGASRLGSSAVGRCASWVISNRFNNAKQIQDVRAPTLVIHGKADSLIPWTQGQAVFDACGANRKHFYLAETMDHCYTMDDVEMFVLPPMADFFELHKQTRRCRLDLPPYVFIPPESCIEDLSERLKCELWDLEADDCYTYPDEIVYVEDAGDSKRLRPSSLVSELDPDADSDWAEAGVNERQLERLILNYPEAEEPPWVCSFCTLQNKPIALCCAVCGSQRSVGPDEPPKPPPPQPRIVGSLSALSAVSDDEDDDDGNDGGTSDSDGDREQAGRVGRGSRPLYYSRSRRGRQTQVSRRFAEMMADQPFTWNCAACTYTNLALPQDAERRSLQCSMCQTLWDGQGRHPGAGKLDLRRKETAAQQQHQHGRIRIHSTSAGDGRPSSPSSPTASGGDAVRRPHSRSMDFLSRFPKLSVGGSSPRSHKASDCPPVSALSACSSGPSVPAVEPKEGADEFKGHGDNTEDSDSDPNSPSSRVEIEIAGNDAE